ncbi:extracellular solute-binding protein, family 3 [Oceaniovalibus guishaninsula JLT2003]|uniref:Extracellular solute-binding protein, family 3 n=1 Tax=Oceaniovalibus guishaninsula JLT2003 TaxID=1231392 RepID=K2HFK3_9RHOB|nr:transporter substrate-binding domain-containing protein [Oceaniovalibus guishaninsula]EKE45267.1 extracellular solute-binding protein, family 3 [Oceaniovalibus guishaninsula JLT2003]
MTKLLPTLAVILAGLTVPAWAQDRITIGMVEQPPYATLTADGSWTGMAPTLWRLIAERENVDYDIVPIAYRDVADALDGGRIDVAGPVYATAEIERAVDLTLPFHTSTLGLAAPQRSEILSVVRGFASIEFLRLVLTMSVLLLIVGGIVWLVERRRNEDQFSRKPLQGLGDGFWWAGVTLTTIGYGDKAPITTLGRTVAMLWMMVGLAVSAALTAAIVTLAGAEASNLRSQIADKDVGVVSNSTSERFLRGREANIIIYSDMESMLDALEEGEDIEMAAGANLVLRDALRREGHSFTVEETQLDPIMVGFATAEGSPLRDAMNRALLAALSDESGWDIVSRYVDE